MSESVNVGSNLIRIHRVITRALDVALEHCNAWKSEGMPAPAVRDGYFKYVECMTTILHGHHIAEDKLAFPCFQMRVPNAPYEKLAAEHEAMQPMIVDIRLAIGRMRDNPEAALPELHAALTALRTLWHEHIGTEEHHFSCSVLAELLKPAEHLELGQNMARFGQEHSEPHDLTLPFVLFNLPPDERALMEKMLPTEVTQHLIPVVWKERWVPMQPFLLV